jgi:histidine triad (HIT) family protein
MEFPSKEVPSYMAELMTPHPCIFCEIASGIGVSGIVYEDARTMAFMNIRQANPGHVLVIPKQHVEVIFDLDDETAAALSITLAKVSRAVRDAFGVSDMNIWQSNGAVAGQEIFHVHFHILPRCRGDALFQVYQTLPKIEEHTTLAVYADRIKKFV